MAIRFNIPEQEFRGRAVGIRALVFDLDDTLLNSEKQIPERALAAIRQLQEAGIFITLCTARNCSATQYYARLLGIRGVYSAVSGCQLVDAETGALLLSRSISEESAIRLVQHCMEIGAPFSLSAGYQGYLGGPIDLDGEYLKLRASRRRVVDPVHSMLRLTDPEVLRGQTIYKVVVHCEDFLDEISGFIRRSAPDAQCVVTSKGIINIFPAGSDKGAGVRQIAEYMKLAPEQICAFGDFANDIPMFQAAGLSVAMGNAGQTVRDSACAVAAPADEDGIAELLESVFLSQEERSL